MSTNILSQDRLILSDLMKFYRQNGNLHKMLKIIKSETKISLRIIDWFVTNYAKKNYTIIQNGAERFKVHLGYKQKLKAYNKKKFDPFCRWERITVPYDESGETLIETTVGQLNFFKWALEHRIIDYIEEHYDEIEKDMMNRNSMSKKNMRQSGMGLGVSAVSEEATGGSTTEDTLESAQDSTAVVVAAAATESVRGSSTTTIHQSTNSKTRKRREELSISAIKSIKKEDVEIVISFN
jgi:ribosomal protein L32